MKKVSPLIPAFLFSFLLTVPATCLAHGDEHKAEGGHGRDSTRPMLLEEGSGSSAMEASTRMPESSKSARHMEEEGSGADAMDSQYMGHGEDKDRHQGIQEESHGEESMPKAKKMREGSGI